MDVKKGKTQVHVNADDIKNLDNIVPATEVVTATEEFAFDVTEDVVGGVVEGVFDEGGVVDTAVSITSDTLGLVDSILRW